MEANNYSGNSEYLKGQQVNSTPTFIEDFVGESFWVYFYKVINKDFNSKSKTISFGSSVKNILFLDTSSPVVKKCYLGSNMVTKANNLNSKQTAQWLFAEQREISFNGIFEELYEYDFFITIGEQISEENKYNSYHVNSGSVNTFQKKSEQKSQFGDTVNLDVSQQQVTVTLNNQNVFVNASGRTIDLVLLKTNQINSIKNKLLSSIKLTAPQQFLPSKVSVKGLNANNNIIEFDTFMNDKLAIPFRLEPVSVGQSSYFLAPAFTKNSLRWQDIVHAGNFGLTTNFNFYKNFGVGFTSGEEINVNNGTLNYTKLKCMIKLNNSSGSDNYDITRFNVFTKENSISWTVSTGFGFSKVYYFGKGYININDSGTYFLAKLTTNDLGDVVQYLDGEGNSHTISPVILENADVTMTVVSNTSFGTKSYDLSLTKDAPLEIKLSGGSGLARISFYINNEEKDFWPTNDYYSSKFDITFKWKNPMSFKITTLSNVIDNEIGDFVKSILSIYANYKLGFPNAKFDANGVDPVNQMAVIKNFVINNGKDMKKTIDNIINNFIRSHSIYLSEHSQDEYSSKFRERWQSCLSFLNSMGEILETEWTMNKTINNTYNQFYINLYSASAPTQISDISSGTREITKNSVLFNLIPELKETSTDSIYYFNDLNGSADSEYFNWTPVQSPNDPNIYSITNPIPKSNILNKPYFIFDISLKSDYSFENLDDQIQPIDLTTDTSKIDTSKSQWQRYNFYVPLEQEQLISFLGNYGQFNSTSYLSQNNWIDIISPFYKQSQFTIGFSNNNQIKPSQLEISGIWGGSCVLEFTYVNASGSEQEIITINTDILNPLDESVSQTIYMF